eukprot:scaffold15914_cov140-Skeletonema_marinoi.AAC.14
MMDRTTKNIQTPIAATHEVEGIVANVAKLMGQAASMKKLSNVDKIEIYNLVPSSHPPSIQ